MSTLQARTAVLAPLTLMGRGVEVEAEACMLCQVSRMAPQGSMAEKYLRSEGSGSRPHPGTPPQRTRSGASGAAPLGPCARAAVALQQRRPQQPLILLQGEHAHETLQSGSITASLFL